MVDKKDIVLIIKSGIPFCLPLLLLIAIGFFVIPSTIEYLKEVIAFCFLTAIFWSLILLVSNLRIRKYLTYSSILLLNLLMIVKLSFYSHYGVKLSASALFVIFETNATEASDFLSNYFSLKVVLILIANVLVFSLAIRILKKNKNLNFNSKAIIKLLGAIVICISLYNIHLRFTTENIILSCFNSYEEYKTTKKNLKKHLAQPLSSHIIANAISNDKQTYIVVIGESTSRWHMQLYGYERETNPKLTEIRNELIIFDSVITPNVHTLSAIQKIATLSDLVSPGSENSASIVQLANAAKFETFWISNQKPVGIHESIPTIISSAAKHKKYVSTNGGAYDIYDETLLPYLDEALNNKAEKKLIFLHLIGTHTRYNKRYPKSFDFFKDETTTLYKHNKSKELINEYDNAVRYNDFIIREIIERVRAKNENSYVVYFSDHGDEVFDTFDFVGHNEYHGTKPMYEIPFIAWFSKKYKQKDLELFQIDGLESRRYIMEDFIHSFAEISKISFDRFNPEKSIFNQNFKVKTRLVRMGDDYDKR